MGRPSRWLTSVADRPLVAPVGWGDDCGFTVLDPVPEVAPWFRDYGDDDLRGLPLRWVYLNDDPFPVLERLSECE